jgi:hypothetical protein
MLLEWEAAAINAPQPDATAANALPADAGNLAKAAVWVGGTVASAVLGNSASDALKANVISFLVAWRSRHGPNKLEELKQQVFGQIHKQYPDPQQGEALHQAVEQLFARAGE